MKHFQRYARRRLSLIAAALLAAAVAVTGVVATTATAKAAPIRVMTYNIRFAASTPPHAWSSRLPMMIHQLKADRPDLLGVQEAYWPQMRDLQAALPGYGWVGMGVHGGTQGEFTAIYYRRDRFDVLDFDHFWLSATPLLIGSKSWGTAYVRMVTWVKFRDRRTGAVFYQLNTHMDNEAGAARTHSAQLILQRVRGLDNRVPVLATGDFNAPANTSQTYSILTGPDAFTNTWWTAAKRGPNYGSLNDWNPPAVGGDRIDWILSRGNVRTLSTSIDTYRHNGQNPSDHFPVIADVVINR